MDAEIAALQAKLAKARALKQGILRSGSSARLRGGGEPL